MMAGNQMFGNLSYLLSVNVIYFFISNDSLKPNTLEVAAILRIIILNS